MALDTGPVVASYLFFKSLNKEETKTLAVSYQTPSEDEREQEKMQKKKRKKKQILNQKEGAGREGERQANVWTHAEKERRE